MLAEDTIREVDNEERNCAVKLKEHNSDDKNGIIGESVVPDGWVVRKPSDIYWNGLRTIGIFKEPYSIKEYYCQELLLKQEKSKKRGNRKGDENERDDDWTGGSGLPFLLS